MQVIGKFYIVLNIASPVNYFWSQTAQNWTTNPKKQHSLIHGKMLQRNVSMPKITALLATRQKSLCCKPPRTSTKG
jgi:hypothetical protein